MFLGTNDSVTSSSPNGPMFILVLESDFPVCMTWSSLHLKILRFDYNVLKLASREKEV